MKRKTISAILCISLLSLSACHKSPRHYAAVGASGLSVVTLDGEKLVEQLYGTTYTNPTTGKVEHFISKQEAGGAVQGIDRLTSANDVFIARIRALPYVDTTNKTLVIGYFNELVGAAQDLNRQGQFNFKNPDAQKQVSLWLATVPVALSSIETIIGSVGNTQPALTGQQLANQIVGKATP